MTNRGFPNPGSLCHCFHEREVLFKYSKPVITGIVVRRNRSDPKLVFVPHLKPDSFFYEITAIFCTAVILCSYLTDKMCLEFVDFMKNILRSREGFLNFSERERGMHFSVEIKKVYTIVIFEQSTGVFHEKNIGYLHRGKTIIQRKFVTVQNQNSYDRKPIRNQLH
jgi:hypothetical protein